MRTTETLYLYETFQQEQYSATESQQLPLQLVEIIAEGQNFRQAADDNEAHLKEKKNGLDFTLQIW